MDDSNEVVFNAHDQPNPDDEEIEFHDPQVHDADEMAPQNAPENVPENREQNELLREINEQIMLTRNETRQSIREIQSNVLDDIGKLRREFNVLQNNFERLNNKVNTPILANDPLNFASREGNGHSTPILTQVDRNENHSRPSPVNEGSIRGHNSSLNTRQNLKLKPEKFDGTEDFEEYISQFEIIAEINNWDSEAKALYLAGSLRSCARSILSELTTSDRKDYDKLVRLLM